MVQILQTIYSNWFWTMDVTRSQTLNCLQCEIPYWFISLHSCRSAIRLSSSRALEKCFDFIHMHQSCLNWLYFICLTCMAVCKGINAVSWNHYDLTCGKMLILGAVLNICVRSAQTHDWTLLPRMHQKKKEIKTVFANAHPSKRLQDSTQVRPRLKYRQERHWSGPGPQHPSSEHIRSHTIRSWAVERKKVNKWI